MKMLAFMQSLADPFMGFKAGNIGAPQIRFTSELKLEPGTWLVVTPEQGGEYVEDKVYAYLSSEAELPHTMEGVEQLGYIDIRNSLYELALQRAYTERSLHKTAKQWPLTVDKDPE